MRTNIFAPTIITVIFSIGPLTAFAAPVQCSNDPSNNHYYEVIVDYGTPGPVVTWEEARGKAENTAINNLNGRQGHLATITSSLEDQCIYALRNQAGIGGLQVWVGGFQLENSNAPGTGWQWINGEGEIPGVNGGTNYANWRSGEPNDGGGIEDNQENYLAIGLYGESVWNDSVPTQGFFGGYVVEYDSVVEATTCQEPGGCDPSGVQKVELPAGLMLNPEDTLVQELVESAPGLVNFTDPRVDSMGQCTDRRPLDVFGDGSLILPPYLCGSPEFAIIRSAASFSVLQDVVRSEQTPEAIFTETFECAGPVSPQLPSEADLQRRGVFVWQPDDRTELIEKHAIELTNGCGSSRGATRGLSYFVLNLHIDVGIAFGTNDRAVLNRLKILTGGKLGTLGISLFNARQAVSRSDYRSLSRDYYRATLMYIFGNYSGALASLASFHGNVEATTFDTGSGFNFQGDLLMRTENIEFIIDEKIISP